MQKIIKKEDLFYDFTKVLSKKFFEEYPKKIAPGLSYRFEINCLESIPPIVFEIFTKDSKDDDEFYSGFAKCGRELTCSHSGDFFEELIEEILFDMLIVAYQINLEN